MTFRLPLLDDSSDPPERRWWPESPLELLRTVLIDRLSTAGPERLARGG